MARKKVQRGWLLRSGLFSLTVNTAGNFTQADTMFSFTDISQDLALIANEISEFFCTRTIVDLFVFNSPADFTAAANPSAVAAAALVTEEDQVSSVAQDPLGSAFMNRCNRVLMAQPLPIGFDFRQVVNSAGEQVTGSTAAYPIAIGSYGSGHTRWDLSSKFSLRELQRCRLYFGRTSSGGLVTGNIINCRYYMRALMQRGARR